jgi:hypothetical protein
MTHLALSLLAALLAADLPPANVSLLDGGSATGSVVSWDRAGLTLETGDGKQKLPAGRLLQVHWQGADQDAGKDARFLELVDGSRLAIADFTVKDHVAVVTAPHVDRPLKIRTDLIRGVELQPASDASRAAWHELATKKPAGDVLLVAKRGGESVDYLEGVLGDLSAEEARFDWDGEKVTIKRSKIVALAYYHDKPSDMSDALCEIETADGSKLSARDVDLADGKLRVTTRAGVRLELNAGNVRRADFSAGKLAYLSDMTPVVARWTPRIATPMSPELKKAYGMPRSDQSFAGSALSLLWKDDSLPARRDLRVYAKGLAIRSRTELEYRLPSGMRRFTAIAGIDPLAVAQGHVELQIRADGKMLWQGAVAGQRPPVELDLDLAGARRLQLLVDYGQNLDFGDRLHLVEARVTK